MTPEEAIERIRKIRIAAQATSVGVNSFRPIVYAFDAAEKAIEKQIPKKPLSDNEYYLEGICPTCGVHFLDKGTKYCGNCGQALNWEDEENDS